MNRPPKPVIVKKDQNLGIIPIDFISQGDMPLRFYYENENLVPAFQLTNIPEQTESLAIIMEDLDTPGKNHTHWIVYNINPNLDEIGGKVPFGTIGKNSWTIKEFQGVNPIFGVHRYRFTIYALKINLEMSSGYNSDSLNKIIKESAFESAFVEVFSEKKGDFSLG